MWGLGRSTLNRNRYRIAKQYLRGDGIEVGALHEPLELPRGARINYVDMFPRKELVARHPELDARRIVEVHHVDDGETLATIADGSHDFVIYNHVLEHTKNPIGTIQNILRVLKTGGIAYLSIPDKRFTFDRKRAVTPLEHVIADYESPRESEEEHYYDVYRNLDESITELDKKGISKADTEKIDELVRECVRTNANIHFHVWTEYEMVAMLMEIRKRYGFPFEIEHFVLNCSYEGVFILRKADRQPGTLQSGGA